MIDPLLVSHSSPRAAELVSLADRLARDFALRAAEHDHDGSFPFANLDALRSAELHLLTVPCEFGGWGASLPEAVLVLERLARGDGPTALVFAMHVQTMGSLSESRAWPEDRFSALCRDVVAEGALINSAASEPELGSPSRGGLPATTARWNGSGWTLDGRKTFASGAPALTYFLVPARLDAPEMSPDSVGVFIVRRGQPGWSVEETWNVMGMRSTGSHDLVFNGLSLEPDRLALRREPGTPEPGKISGGAWFGLSVAAVYLGIAEAARDAAVEFAHNRKPTALEGKPIASLEVIQRGIGAIEAELLPARALLYSVAAAWSRRDGDTAQLIPYLGPVKVTATTSAIAAVDLALRVVGGQSMSRALPLERYFRDVRAGLFHPPTEETAHSALGRAVLGY
ncbi:MAG TPA: acyl-CoA dehydrogenase family protein [Herpetosiphonaceae bacterium]|nr:acyl-CoA dehydrogenase family protein [Herpetosiphonaceae bacterium]